MPTLVEVAEAAKGLAPFIGADCCYEYLERYCKELAEYPERKGFPKSYKTRPNWTEYDLRREISAVLWGLPTHPSRIAKVYRYLPFRILKEIADGRIASVWEDAPTSKIRHQYLVELGVAKQYHAQIWRDWANNPWRWYCRHCPIGDHNPRGQAVADWLIVKKDWAGWRRPLPIGYGPDGVMKTIQPQTLLDEIWPTRHLPNGSKTNPEKVFRQIMEEKGEEELKRIAAENALFPQMPWTTIPGIVQILRASDLVAEGQRMSHCVGGYEWACKNGECYILRLPNSTAEIRRDGSVYQHRAYKNSDPSPSDKTLLARWVASRKEIRV